MIFRFPVRRFLQGTEKTEKPQNRFGTLQWVLSRPLYRFQTFDFTQVPKKNRTQALRLELAQWTPFASSDYYVGWHDHLAFVWGWDANKVNQAVVAQGLKPQRVRILPDSVLQTPVENGLVLNRCHEGYEGQLWRKGKLEHSRWWPRLPQQDEWLMFQRDTGLPSGEQQHQLPESRFVPLNFNPWVKESGSVFSREMQIERLTVAIVILLLLTPTLWYGLSAYRIQRSTARLHSQQALLQHEVEPIMQARSQALEALARIHTLRELSPYPEQLVLMANIAEILPKDNSYVKSWDFQQGQLKIVINSPGALSATLLISALQQTGLFKDVKTLPGSDPKSAMFQMDVLGN